MSEKPLTAAEIEARLDEPLDPVLSSHRRMAVAARDLAELARPQQEFVLHWVGVIARTNVEMAYQLAGQAPHAVRSATPADLEEWIVRAMDVYDKDGLYPACAVLRDVDAFLAAARAGANGVRLEDVARVLEYFLGGLSGRALKLEAAAQTYTDTAGLYLPARLAWFPARDDNFRLYKAMAVHLWAQTWYGTFQTPAGEPDLAALCAGFADPGVALRLFHALETIRLDACIAADLAGLHREMRELRERAGDPAYPPEWAPYVAVLRDPAATVHESYTALRALYPGPLPSPACYQGSLLPERVDEVARARQAREQEALRNALGRMLAESDAPDARARAGRFQTRVRADVRQPGRGDIELLLDGRPVAPPDEVRALLGSIHQDFGEIPPEYLVAAGDGGYDRGGAQRLAADVWQGAYHEEGAFLYNEWDHRRRHYRKDWCVLREIDVHPGAGEFVDLTLRKYAGVLPVLRKTFEALRGEDRLLKKQSNGDNIDFDALVEAHADMKRGHEVSERLFTKLAKLERDIAVMFMVDMSGSTKGWINDAERESLVLLCEALEVLGDRYAIYGFSGMTRKRCELYRIKRFEEPYSDAVRARISGILPKDYTRMGVTIRHLTALLNRVEAKTKLLIALSDGKPDDYDGYRGDYGIEDTRVALIEAKRTGIHPFCITIDTEARDYLPHMYGAVNYTLIDDVRKLPLRVSEIYRHLTT